MSGFRNPDGSERAKLLDFHVTPDNTLILVLERGGRRYGSHFDLRQKDAGMWSYWWDGSGLFSLGRSEVLEFLEGGTTGAVHSYYPLVGAIVVQSTVETLQLLALMTWGHLGKCPGHTTNAAD